MSSSATIDVVNRPAVRRSEEERMRASRRRGWVLAGYSLVLLTVAGVLTSVSDPGAAWRAYGLACLVFGALVGVVAAVLLLRERGLLELPGRVSRATVRASQGIVARRSAAATRRHPSTRVVGGYPGMAVTHSRVVRAEWTKLYSLRSTTIILAAAVLLIVGLAGILAAVFAAQWDTLAPAERDRFRPGTDPLSGIVLAQLAVGVLGVLTASSEYANGMIRSTLAAVPRRIPVLWAKLVVLAALVGSVGVASMFVAFWLAQAVLSGEGLAVGLDEPYVWHVILTAPVYLVLVATVGLALGALLRHTAAAISVMVGLLFLIPILFAFLPSGWSRAVSPYLFAAAGGAFWSVPQGARQITSATAAFVVLSAWAGAMFAGACYRMLREDA